MCAACCERVAPLATALIARHCDGFVCGNNPGLATCIPDAAAGAGSDQAERSQPNGAGSHRSKEKTENGLSSSRRQCRGEKFMAICNRGAVRNGLDSLLLLFSLFYYSSFGHFLIVNNMSIEITLVSYPPNHAARSRHSVLVDTSAEYERMGKKSAINFP